MKPHVSSFAVALITAIALTSTPATAQHRGGHSGGGRVSAGVMHRGIHAGAGRQISTGRMVYGRAVPRGRVTAPYVHRHGTRFIPSYRLGVPGFAVGIGVGAYRYPYGYYPYSFGYYPYGYSYYPYSYRYPAYYEVRVVGGNTITYRARLNPY
jgi:hypothetical protein